MVEPLKSWFDLSEKILIMDEGVSYRPYKDTKGLWTIGIGCLIGSKLEDLYLPWKAIKALFDERVFNALKDLIAIFGEDYFNFSSGRQMALLSMMYSLGRHRFSGFQRMIAAIKSDDWEKASKEALDSKWATDVDPKKREGEGRDDRVAYMLKTGDVHPAYD